MLELPRLEQPEAVERFGQVEMVQVVGKVLDDFSPLCEEKGITCTLDAPPSLPCLGNDVLLEQMLANLVENALRFTPRQGRIVVRLAAARPNHVVLAIVDSGPGVPPAERAQVFNRFERGDHPQPGHHGLGLAIVQEIVRLHSGRIQLTDGDLGGACFTITLPCVRDGHPATV